MIMKLSSRHAAPGDDNFMINGVWQGSGVG
ncbi:hypothetical protein MILUP08_45810 [Micromonospora lupini str. Lupac 08]|uniref:Uncharacterized protein n=1 Tax=Micromonospora lupini str. Lupac 08 TaxID=1150864 RepID=I0LAR9_9ACTN|nr:hypothetical protein MILUP08_45810 [Micromonospora lupini str. Lupac 08]